MSSSPFAGFVPAAGAGGLEIAAFLLLGALGSVHCLGMCGPLVSTYAEGIEARGHDATEWPAIRQHLLFNAGRTVSYAALGVGFGALGAILVDAGALLSVARLVRGVVGVVVGLLVLALGVGYLAADRGGGGLVGALGRPFRVGGATLSGVVAWLRARAERWTRGPRIVGLGAAHGLLPCPLLYPAFLYALATASPLRGGVALAALGAGTVPTLFATGLAVGSLGPDARRRLHRVLGAAFVVLAAVPLRMGLRSLGVEPLALLGVA
ncbi:MAG: sulfite exporter TauE/SafE family protein [Haloglomus sp.]